MTDGYDIVFAFDRDYGHAKTFFFVLYGGMPFDTPCIGMRP